MQSTNLINVCGAILPLFSSDWDQQDSHASTLTDTSQWSLQCSTEEEWNSLADSLRGSKDTNDRALLSVLSDKFLDSIPELIEAKVCIHISFPFDHPLPCLILIVCYSLHSPQ